MLRKETVAPELLVRIARLQKDELFTDYLLAGGTALALQTGFRGSEDIDMFALKKQDNVPILNYFRENFSEVKVDYDNPGVLNLYIDGIKTDVCGIRGKLLETPIREDGIAMFSLNDIAAMKLSAVCGRKRAKDYIDIAYFLTNCFSLDTMLGLYKVKYSENDIFIVKKALLEYNKVNLFEWEKVKIMDTKFFASNVPGIIKSALEDYNRKEGITRKWLRR